MEIIKIRGGKPLIGKIQVSGSKNSTLPIMAASLLTNDNLVLSNVPHLIDIATMSNLLLNHGTEFILDGFISQKNIGRTIILNSSNITNLIAPYDIVRKMRASVLVLGPLLSRFGKAKVSLPGGCAIGTRPIDLHLEALRAMGAEISLENGYVEASVKGKLKGANINFSKVSVGATENIIMAATLAEGKTVLSNAAREPEIVDLINCLIAMGAKIKGAGESIIEIEGVDSLHGAQHSVIGDRIEAATYAIAAAITKGSITLTGISSDLLANIFDQLLNCGVRITEDSEGIHILASEEINSIDITTQVFPGFSTDVQAQFMALMCLADGTSMITENIFENRFMHVSELNRMGADISINGNIALVKGVKKFKGAEVMATDLRASVSLVLAGLVAEGETIINRIYHIDRGYEYIEEKLSSCGADIERVRC